ncbi:MAG: hypothetical protein WBA33_12905 [Rhodanobacter lindaniclasticus]
MARQDAEFMLFVEIDSPSRSSCAYGNWLSRFPDQGIQGFGSNPLPTGCGPDVRMSDENDRAYVLNSHDAKDFSFLHVAREPDACTDLAGELRNPHVRFMPSVDRDDTP